MFARMPKSSKTKRLRDSYGFPQFHPALTVTGLFGEPHGGVISLPRRSKKRRAEFVAGYKAGGMTANCAGSGIFLLEACVLAIPSFFEIKESGGVHTLSEKNLIIIF